VTDSLEINDGRATLRSTIYNPYFPLLPHEILERALSALVHRLADRGLVAGHEIVFTQDDDPLDRFDRCWEPGMISGPWYHQYTISTPVVNPPRQPALTASSE
jgi:hypothetical protein